MAKKKVQVEVQEFTPEGDPETPEEIQMVLDAIEARKAKRRNNPEAPTPEPVVTVPEVEQEYTSGSERTATAEDPTGSVEVIIQNSLVEAPESPVDELINEVGTSDNSSV